MTTLFKFTDKEIEVKTGIMISKEKELKAYFRRFSAKDKMDALFGKTMSDIIIDMFVRFNATFEVEINDETIEITNLRQLLSLPANDDLGNLIANCINSMYKAINQEDKEATKTLKK